MQVAGAARASCRLALGLALAGCETHAVSADAGPSEPSPNASILPAPLATGPDTASAAVDAGPLDAGLDAETPPPTAAREDEPLGPDTEELRDLSGVALHARFRWPDVPVPARSPETNSDALDRARAAASFDLEIASAAAGRLRVTLTAPRFVLPVGTELRARTSSYGHVLVWPGGQSYVVAQPGALRTLLNERRTDVVPLTRAAGAPRGASQALGFTTERVSFATPLGHLELEQAHVLAAGAGGALLCRFVVEIVGVHPDSAACRPELIPVHADYTWAEGGRLTFEVTSVQRAAVLEIGSLRTPPLGASLRIGDLPAPPIAQLVDRSILRSIRLRAAAVHPAKDAPKDGLLVVNPDDLLRYALVDGLPVARLEPKSPGLLLDLLPGTYAISARTFLSDELIPPAAGTAPGRFVTAEAPRSE